MATSTVRIKEVMAEFFEQLAVEITTKERKVVTVPAIINEILLKEGIKLGKKYNIDTEELERTREEMTLITK